MRPPFELIRRLVAAGWKGLPDSDLQDWERRQLRTWRSEKLVRKEDNFGGLHWVVTQTGHVQLTDLIPYPDPGDSNAAVFTYARA